MATFRERKRDDGTVIFNVQVRQAGFPSRTASFPTRRQAERWAKVTEASMIEGKHFRNVESRRRTFAEAADKYILEEIPKKRGGGGMHRAALAYWRESIGHLKLSDINAALLSEQRSKLSRATYRRADPASKRTSLKDGETAREFKRSTATVNRYLAVLSHVFSIARREWHWLDHNPLEQVSRLRETNGRVRHLTPDERLTLLVETAKSPKLHAFVVLALSTACRAGELLKLTWPDVDTETGRLLFRETKNGQPRTAWIGGEALRLLKELPVGKGRVFPNDSGADGPWEYREGFKLALAAATIENFRFHDLRHSAATELARLGASEQQLKAIGGWKSSIVSKYVHLSATDSRELTSKLNEKLFEAKA